MRDINKIQSLYWVFTFLAVISFLGLDYITWKKGEESYVFSIFPKQEKILPNKKSLIRTVEQQLFSRKIPQENINKYSDKEGICHIMVRLTPKKYRSLEKGLDENFLNINASILKKREKHKDEIEHFLWEVDKKGEIPLSLLFSIEPEKKITESDQVYAPKYNAALIIDDMGNSIDNIKDICSLKKDLTIAVLPFSPFAKETARIAHQNGLEVILHLPLESMNNVYDNENTLGIINSRMDQKEITNILYANLKQVPFISGVNTHMGSKITKDKKIMGIILDKLRKQNLYFIDSRTTAQSVAYNIAQKMNIPSAYRHVFLDSKTEQGYIKSQLIKLFETAEKNGSAVGICHPFPETIQVLKENIHRAEKFNVNLLFASKIVN